MEHITEIDNKTSSCIVCKKIYKTTSIKSHLQTSTHKNNLNKYVFIKKDLKDSTKDNIIRATNVINDIIINNKVKHYDISTIYEHMKAKYKLNTIETYLRLGLINNKNLVFTSKQIQDMDIFIKNIQAEIYKERSTKETIINEVNINDVINNDDKYNDIVEFYKLLPLRASEFVRLKLVSYEECTKDGNNKIDTDYNYIIVNDKLLIFNNTKTSKYDEVKLNDSVMLFITTRLNRKIDTNKPIFNKTLRTFERIIKNTGYTTQQIRKIYANSNKDNVPDAARLLNHTIGTHLLKYCNTN